MKKQFQLRNRREFLEESLRGAALVAALASGNSRAEAAASPKSILDTVGVAGRTDPKLVHYEEISRWKSPHPESRRITSGPRDRLYLCAGNYVTCLNRSGEAETEIALAEPARCALAGEDGSLLVGLRDHVEVFDEKGQRKARWEPAGKKAWLTGMVAVKDDVFVCDAGQRVVLRYGRSGKLLKRIGEKDAEREIPGFVVPSPFLRIVLGSDGLLYMNNLGRHRVEAYTPDGDLERTWGKPTFAIEGFCGCCNPIGLAVLPDGRFVTCEKGLPRVKVYSAEGVFESVVAGAESFSENAKTCSSLNDCVHGGLDVATDSEGRVYVLDLVVGDIRVMKRKA